jgi:hypothetical protein
MTINRPMLWGICELIAPRQVGTTPQECTLSGSHGESEGNAPYMSTSGGLQPLRVIFVIG